MRQRSRYGFVEVAVGIVEMALERLSEWGIVDLDEERKAAMVSNLMVVLCGDPSASPIVNAVFHATGIRVRDLPIGVHHLI